MKRIRSGNELLGYLDEDLGWRLKEIASLKRAVRSATGQNQDALLRAAVPILYAHWEGYVKQAAIGYSSYISSLGVKFSAVVPSLGGLKALAYVKTMRAISKRVFVSSELLNKLYAIDEDVADIPLERHISRIGNLNYDLFEQISEFLALSVDSSKRVLIDEKLLKLRNDIAHGEFLLIDVDGFDQLSIEILDLIREFKTALQNAVVLKSYLRTTVPPEAVAVLF
jgi:hypothetical protein